MSMRRDGKDRFYRTLNLDKESKETLRLFRKYEKQIKEDIDKVGRGEEYGS